MMTDLYVVVDLKYTYDRMGIKCVCVPEYIHIWYIHVFSVKGR